MEEEVKLDRGFSFNLNYARCPNCKRHGRDTVAYNKREVEKLFGIKEVEDGRFEVQSWCRLCRAEQEGICTSKRMNMKKVTLDGKEIELVVSTPGGERYQLQRT
jgi:hypothetical protein